MRKKTVVRKTSGTTAQKSKRNTKKANTSSSNWYLWVFGATLLLFVFSVVYHYRHGILYVFTNSNNTKEQGLTDVERKTEDTRIFEVLSRHDTKAVGVDISQYQGNIKWHRLDKIQDEFPVSFVFIRATAGSNKVDTKFNKNWHNAKEHYFIRGAYHYYRPNENSLEQADNFIKTVQLKKGDLPPVLDIEKLPKNQSIENLKVGLRRWLKRVEQHYKVKPIIYSGESYYTDFLKEEFKEYPFWIANYNFFVENIKKDWLFWQFTEKAQVPGIKGLVDVNVYNGTPEDLKSLFIRKN